MELNIILYTIGVSILGAVIGIFILRTIQIKAEQKEFDKQNKNGNITIAPAPCYDTWNNHVKNNEGRN